MEEKKEIRIKFTTLLIIILILVIIGLVTYIMYNPKTQNVSTNNLSNELVHNKVIENEITETVIDDNNKKDNEYEKTTNNISNNLKEELSEEDKKDVEATIKKYYKLLGKKEKEPASMLVELGLTPQAVQDPEYAPSEYVEYPNGEYMWTGIKYNDFIGEMWYVAEDIIKSQFKEFVEYKGYLYIKESFNKSDEYTIQSMELKESSKNKCTYLVKVKKSNNSKTYTQEIILGRGNGDFVIMEINDK